MEKGEWLRVLDQEKLKKVWRGRLCSVTPEGPCYLLHWSTFYNLALKPPFNSSMQSVYLITTSMSYTFRPKVTRTSSFIFQGRWTGWKFIHLINIYGTAPMCRALKLTFTEKLSHLLQRGLQISFKWTSKGVSSPVGTRRFFFFFFLAKSGQYLSGSKLDSTVCEKKGERETDLITGNAFWKE